MKEEGVEKKWNGRVGISQKLRFLRLKRIVGSNDGCFL